MNSTRVITALNAVTDTTTSNKFYVGGAKRIGFLFRRANHTSGKTVFSVNISSESEDTTTPTMTATNMLIPNVAGDNTKTLAHVANIDTSTANGDFYAWLDPVCLVNWVSVTATETTDGTHSAWVICEY
jgi:hypothetical protein